MSYNLLIETQDPDEFEYTLEEKKSGEQPRMYIEGPYLMADGVNRNNRRYSQEQMAKEVARYKSEMISKNRAMGELNHPTTADVDLERACHIVVDLYQKDDPSIWWGKSKILSTPTGKILESLIKDGVKNGVSSRALGKLEKGGDGVDNVTDMRLVAIDCVADPSYADAFVNGILENRTWICDQDGKFHPVYDQLQENLDTLPKKDLEKHVTTAVMDFLQKLKTI